MYENVYTNTGSQDKSLKKLDCPVMWNAYVSIKASVYNILQYSTWETKAVEYIVVKYWNEENVTRTPRSSLVRNASLLANQASACSALSWKTYKHKITEIYITENLQTQSYSYTP